MLEDVTQTSIDDDVTNTVQNYTEPQSSKENNHTHANQLQNIGELPHFEEANTSDSISSHISDCGEPKLFLIDFEYCAYNYRGFDMANHFQEWAYDYTNPEYPFYYENQENTPTLEQKVKPHVCIIRKFYYIA